MDAVIFKSDFGFAIRLNYKIGRKNTFIHNNFPNKFGFILCPVSILKGNVLCKSVTVFMNVIAKGQR